jgi:hypothetical protein
MRTRHFGSYIAARVNFRDLLDTAHTGRVTTVQRELLNESCQTRAVKREREQFAAIDADSDLTSGQHR